MLDKNIIKMDDNERKRKMGKSLRESKMAATSEWHIQEISKQYRNFRFSSFLYVKQPEVVVYPKNVSDVSKVLEYCNGNRVPVVPFGTGTGLEGGVNAIQGGVSLDLMNLDRIVSVNAKDFDCTVQAGVTKDRLNEYLRDTGLFFPVDPGASASLCGMCATSASGTNAVRYGTMRENVINLQVVLPSGEIIHTRGEGRRPRKSAAGYNLTNLFIGAEGTLGVITAATLKLYGIPEKISAAVVSFNSIGAAVDAVAEIMQNSIPVARIELLDEVQVMASNRYSKLNLREVPTLFLEFHGTMDGLKSYIDLTGEICQSANGGPCDFQWANDSEQREHLWRARHNAYYAALALRPNSKGLITDVCVPISKLTSVIVETKKEIVDSKLTGPIIGHVGDGNFHVVFVVCNDEEEAKAQEISDKMVHRALKAGGTCTGEHGIALGKKKYLKEEVGPGTFNLMRLIKSAIDPNNIMNPGKIF